MKKRLMSICIIVILVFCIYGCIQTAALVSSVVVEEVTTNLSFAFEETEYEYSDENWMWE